MSFQDDIQGKNTQLYPIVTIEPPDAISYGLDWVTNFNKCIFISTNNTSLEHVHINNTTTNSPFTTGQTHHFKPILLNIPSIKESIDIESRKFKISNVNLDISNIEYEGERFSDILSDTSLMNWQVSIQFVSPSANIFSTIYPVSPVAGSWNGASFYEAHSGNHQGITIGDIYYAPGERYGGDYSGRNDKLTRMVYQGIIRRISHDDSSCKIELEDLTEQKAHKDLPDDYLGTEFGILDKYKNKPKPMVYGYVDRSPCVLGANKEIIIDSRDIDSLGEGTNVVFGDNISALMIHTGDSYLNVLEATQINMGSTLASEPEDETETIIGDFIENDPQWERDSNIIRLFGTILTQNKILQCMHYHKPTTISLVKRQYEVSGQAIQNKDNLFDDVDVELLMDDNYNVSTNVQPSASYSVPFDNATVGATYSGSTYYKEYVKLTISTSPTLSGIAKTIDETEDSVGERIFPSDESFNIQGIAINKKTLPDTNEEYGYNNRMFIYPDDTLSGSEQYYDSDVFENSGEATPTTLNKAGLEGLFGFPDELSDDNPYSYVSADIDIRLTTALTGITTSPSRNCPSIWIYDWCGLASKTRQGVYMIVFRGHNELTIGEYALTDSATITLELGTVNSPPIFQEIDIKSLVDIKDIYSKDFYVDVNGRMDEDGILIENPIDIIYDLVRSELEHDAINEVEYAEAKLAHTDWKFGFSQTKKISSKKLIEDIAKSTKCFPKFKNDGTFGFNTIKDNYTVSGDYETAHLIKESEVISYSFKKTKPEQIYNEVDVQYNKDYAQDSLLGRTTPPIEVEGGDYYGIDDAYLEFESDYIRDKDTADLLALFLSNQYKNDHLLFNLKLPFQYINIEIGDLVKFEDLFQGVSAYGINYTIPQAPNGQTYYPLFFVTSTQKNLDSVSIECMQLHHLDGEYDYAWEAIHGVEFFGADNLNVEEFTFATPLDVTCIDSQGNSLDVESSGDLWENYTYAMPGSTEVFVYSPTGTYNITHSATDAFGNQFSTTTTITVVVNTSTGDGIDDENYLVDENVIVPVGTFILQGEVSQISFIYEDYWDNILMFDFREYAMFNVGEWIRIEGGGFSANLRITGTTSGQVQGEPVENLLLDYYSSSGEGYVDDNWTGQGAFHDGFDLTITAINFPDIAVMGDANMDNTLDVLDVVSIVQFILGQVTIESEYNADANQDGNINILDVVRITNCILGVGSCDFGI